MTVKKSYGVRVVDGGRRLCPALFCKLAPLKVAYFKH